VNEIPEAIEAIDFGLCVPFLMNSSFKTKYRKRTLQKEHEA
jgi:hypothetical protein